MSYQVLARKWRPKSFSTLVGQEHVVRALTHALDQQRLHHAYLFTGTRGVGKTTLARIMAKALNCEAGVSSIPCGVCSSCQEIDGGRFIDYVELDAASNRGIDDMTQLLERAVYAPTRGRFKVYVIDEVHQLTGHAFNAMLKTLEEPPEHVKFILATTDPQKIPVTVLSRCLQFNLKQMPMTHIVEHLTRVLEAEEVSFEPAALRHLAKGAAGSMRDALSLLDQSIAHGAGKVEEEGVRAMLGTVGDEHLFALLDGLVKQDVQAMLEVARVMDTRSLSFDSGLQELATLFHRIALAQFAPDALLDEAERNRLAHYAALLDAEFLQLCYQIAIHGRNELPLAPDEYAGFVMTLLRLHAFRPERAGAIAATRSVPPAATPRKAATPETASLVASPNASRPASSPAAAAATPAPTFVVTAVTRPAVTDSLPAADDDWHALVAHLPLVGMTKQLAQHCELSERTPTAIRLRLAPLHKSLLGKVQEEKLQTELQKYFGQLLRMEISLADTSGETPAERHRGVQRERQERAVASIEQDPFVREVVDLFDASIDESTIKPV
jgi:DNA polymerase-3 subunit gamma/tau